MPKSIELTLELLVERVSCPGVWLCHDGGVSLSVFVLDSTYETCVQPPIFPLVYNDVFYFRKRFDETLSNIYDLSSLLKEETMYCELRQWCGDSCSASTVLAQYLGALSDVLFLPKTYQADGIDLLMRRSSNYPGILSPKIEIKTKLRLDEFTEDTPPPPVKEASPHVQRKILKPCMCNVTNNNREIDHSRQKQVCHSPIYHRVYCYNHARRRSQSRSRTRLTRPPVEGSWSLCSLNLQGPAKSCDCPSSARSAPFVPPKSAPPCGARAHHAYHVTQGPASCTTAYTQANDNWRQYNRTCDDEDIPSHLHRSAEDKTEKERNAVNKFILDSQYIEQECEKFERKKKRDVAQHKSYGFCDCDICLRRLFEAEDQSGGGEEAGVGGRSGTPHLHSDRLMSAILF